MTSKNFQIAYVILLTLITLYIISLSIFKIIKPAQIPLFYTFLQTNWKSSPITRIDHCKNINN